MQAAIDSGARISAGEGAEALAGRPEGEPRGDHYGERDGAGMAARVAKGASDAHPSVIFGAVRSVVVNLRKTRSPQIQRADLVSRKRDKCNV